MAKAEAHCKCQTCGRTFTVCKDCFNRTNANSFEEYAAANYTECPDCYRKYRNTPSGKIAHAIDEILKLLRIIR